VQANFLDYRFHLLLKRLTNHILETIHATKIYINQLIASGETGLNMIAQDFIGRPRFNLPQAQLLNLSQCLISLPEPIGIPFLSYVPHSLMVQMILVLPISVSVPILALVLALVLLLTLLLLILSNPNHLDLVFDPTFVPDPTFALAPVPSSVAMIHNPCWSKSISVGYKWHSIAPTIICHRYPLGM
jgi:hypothetical protein